jgi:hypothetical protein
MNTVCLLQDFPSTVKCAYSQVVAGMNYWFVASANDEYYVAQVRVEDGFPACLCLSVCVAARP